jgi:hypothetical protein
MNDLLSALEAEAVQSARRQYDMITKWIAERMTGVFGPIPKPAAAPAPRGRLSQERMEEVLATIIELLGKHPEGLRSEQIRAKLAIDKKSFQYAMNLGKESDQVVQSGERRATVYKLPGRTSRAQEEGRVVKRGRKKHA